MLSIIISPSFTVNIREKNLCLSLFSLYFNTNFILSLLMIKDFLIRSNQYGLVFNVIFNHKYV